MVGHILAAQTPFAPERRLSRPASRYVTEHLRRWSSPASGFPDPEVADRYHEALALWPAAHCALEYHRWLVRSRFRADGRRFNELIEPPINVPVCMVQGADDPVAPVRGLERSQRHVAGRFTAQVLPRTGHFPHEEDPVGFTRVLLGWLADLPRG